MAKPKKRDTRRYTAITMVKMLPDEKRTFESEAARRGLPLSTWLRQLARTACNMPAAGGDDGDG
jgi:hypothetical protein